MKDIKIIRPYKRKPLSEKTLEGSLLREGYTRAPGTVFGILPSTDGKGNVLTGIDENSIRVRSIIDPEARKLEIDRITAIRARLEEELGEDLSPTSPFWQEKLEVPYRLKDGDNAFDLGDANQAVDFYWITQLEVVAKSLGDIQSGKVEESDIRYYVYDPELENENEFNRKKQINEVVATLNKLDQISLRKVAFILNLKMPDKSTYHDIYNAVDDFIRTPKAFATSDPILEFKKATSFTPEVLAVKVLIKQLLEERVLIQKGNSLLEGQNLIAKSMEDLETKLVEDEDLFIAYDAKTRAKREYVNNI